MKGPMDTHHRLYIDIYGNPLPHELECLAMAVVNCTYLGEQIDPDTNTLVSVRSKSIVPPFGISLQSQFMFGVRSRETFQQDCDEFVWDMVEELSIRGRLQTLFNHYPNFKNSWDYNDVSMLQNCDRAYEAIRHSENYRLVDETKSICRTLLRGPYLAALHVLGRHYGLIDVTPLDEHRKFLERLRQTLEYDSYAVSSDHTVCEVIRTLVADALCPHPSQEELYDEIRNFPVTYREILEDSEIAA